MASVSFAVVISKQLRMDGGRAQMHLEHFHFPQLNVSPIIAGDTLVIEAIYV